MIKAYVDSSWRDGIAGYGVFIRDGYKERIFSNWIKTDNNNYGELWAIYQAAIFCACHDAVIYTDSQTALAYINKTITDKKRTPEQYIRHQQMKVLAYKINRLGVRVEHVKGHQRKEYDNNLADLLARRGLDKSRPK
jgi:ribonuclease HI